LTEEQQVALLKKQWGRDKPEAFIVVPLRPLLRLVSTSYKSVGILEAVAVLSGDSGQKIRLEAERTERLLNMALDDLTG
jgi:hypothetical protein